VPRSLHGVLSHGDLWHGPSMAIERWDGPNGGIRRWRRGLDTGPFIMRLCTQYIPSAEMGTPVTNRKQGEFQ
jgi:hypothetical protein